MPPGTPILDPLFSRNFGGLVLLCIEADFCEQGLIFQHFSRSTRSTFLRTGRNSKFLQKFVWNFADFFEKINIFYQIHRFFLSRFSYWFWWKFFGISTFFSKFVKNFRDFINSHTFGVGGFFVLGSTPVIFGSAGGHHERQSNTIALASKFRLENWLCTGVISKN